MEKYPYVVSAQEGANLHKQPILNSKTADGKANIIRKLPLGTPIGLESAMISNEGRNWVLISLEIENEEQIGWMEYENIVYPTKHVVTNLKGTDLRKEPNLKLKTKNGENNIIFSLPVGTRFVQMSSETCTNDDHEWGLVRLESGNKEIGWVDFADWLDFQTLIVTAQQGTILRKEPGLKSITKDGKNNIIRSLAVQTRVVIVNANPITIPNSNIPENKWILISPERGGDGEVGWVVVNHLGREPILAQATPGDYCVFVENGGKYYIKPADWQAYSDQRIQIKYTDMVYRSYTCFLARGIRYKVLTSNWNQWTKEAART